MMNKAIKILEMIRFGPPKFCYINQIYNGLFAYNSLNEENNYAKN